MRDAFVLSCLVSCSLNLFAAEYFVGKTNCSAGGGGTFTAPFCSIQDGVNAVSASQGGIVSVRAGTYKGGVLFNTSGSSGNPIVLRNYQYEKVIIDQGTDYAATRANVVRVILQGAGKNAAGAPNPIGWITIEGIEIANGYDGIKMHNAHDVIVRNCIVRDSLVQGILVKGSQRLLFDRNTVINNGKPSVIGYPTDTNLLHGYYVSGNYVKITNNVIYGNASYGIQVSGDAFDTANYYSAEFNGANNWLIANNTIAFQKNRGGICVADPRAINSRIENNIFYENALYYGEGSIDFFDSGTGHAVKNNLFYSSLGRRPITENKPGLYSSTNVWSQLNPLFVNASAFDFRLSSTASPAFDKGILLSSEVRGDRDNNPRPQYTTHDLGAYEFGSGTPTSVKPLPPQNLKAN
jgi:parallel beta-helix repeat protein